MGRFSGNKTLLVLLTTAVIFSATAAGEDFVIDGVYEAAFDLPRIFFLLKRDINGPPLDADGVWEYNYAILDTGASGLLLSYETAELFNISTIPGAQYADVGVGGEEFFDVSEALYLGTLDFNSIPGDPGQYLMNPLWHFQVKQTPAGLFPYDLIGMPAMADKVVVLDPSRVAMIDYFKADIKEVNAPDIPAVDINVALVLNKYITPENPNNIGPLPVLSYNPVIPGIKTKYNGTFSKGDFLLDTGGTVSIISYSQAFNLGLMDEYGNPLVPEDFNVPISGVGGQTVLPGFQLESLSVPTLNGYDIIFENARLCVHDIGIIDSDGRETILDGIFGSNFLCPSYSLTDINGIGGTIFNRIVINMKEGLLSFDVNDAYELPANNPKPPFPDGDLNRDWFVDIHDMMILGKEWLNDCDKLNWDCHQADMYPDDKVNFLDYSKMANQYGTVTYPSLAELAGAWLSQQDDDNWEPRFDIGPRMTGDGIINFIDFAVISTEQ